MTLGELRASGDQAVRALQWTSWADEDYFASRLLLLAGMLLQGTQFGCTCLEKYLKAVCTLAGVSFDGVGHDISKLNGLLHHRGIKKEIKPEFLRHLNKAYQLRYPDDLQPGFSIAMNSTAIMVELDRTVFEIRKGFGIQRSDNREAVTKFDIALKSRSPELLTRNCSLGAADKKQLYSEPSWSYELRAFESGTFMEAKYTVRQLEGEDHFNRKGFTPKGDGKTFDLAWTPWEEAAGAE